MKKKLIIAGIIVGLIGLMIVGNIIKSKSTGAFSNGKAVEVRVTNAKIQDINSTVSVNGVFEEVDKKEVYFNSAVKVEKILVKENQEVTKGQKLVNLDLSELNSQLNQSRVNLSIQKIGLKKLTDSSNLQDITKAEAEVKRTKSAVEEAKENCDRMQQLYAQGAVSQVDYKDAKTQYDNAVLQYDTAQASLNEMKKNNSDTLKNNGNDIENQTQQVRLAELKIQELEDKMNQLNEDSISPMNGVVSQLNLEEGSMTNPAAMAIKIINPGSLRVNLEVKEFDILKIKVGQPVNITGDAFPDKTIKGTVESIGSVAIKKQGTNSDQAFVEVTVLVNDPERILKPGFSVSADIITETKKGAVVMPFDTLQEDKDGNKWVFAIENGIAKQKNIKIGISSGLDMEVTSGLKGKEELVSDPPSRLKDGMKVIIQK